MARQDTSSNRIKYEDPSYPVSVVYTDLANIEMTDSAWQWHEDIVVIIVNNGTAQITSDDQSIRLLPGQAVLIGRNVMHTIQQYGPEQCAYYSLTFHPDYIMNSTPDSIHDEFLNIIDNNNIRLMIFDENVSWHSHLLDYMNDIIVANMLRPTGYQIATKGYLCLSWALLVAHLHEENMDALKDLPITQDEQRVKDAMSYIRDNYTEKLSLDEVAEHIHISKSECCRCFKRTIGMTPFEYLMKYRVFQAANMLKDSSYAESSIADIALSCGFNNLSYFSKLFGKYMNCTPRQYRNNLQSQTPSTDFMSLR